MKEEVKSYTVKIGEFTVEVTCKQSATMRLRFTTKRKFKATCPLYVSKSTMTHFLKGHYDWMKRKYESTLYDNKSFYDDKSVVIFGKTYPVKVVDGCNFSYRFNGEEFIVTKRSNSDKETAIKRGLKELLSEMLAIKLTHYNAVMGLYHSEFTVREMTSLWGSCRYANKKLTFNLKLISKPIECLEYIVVHELAHIKVHNHRKEFWDFVGKYMPNYKQLDTLLKE